MLVQLGQCSAARGTDDGGAAAILRHITQPPAPAGYTLMGYSSLFFSNVGRDN